MNKDKMTIIDAVMQRNPELVASLIDQGTNLEMSNHKGETPLILAGMTDQFRIAETLLEGGANPFAASRIGWTIGFAAEASRLRSGPDYEAKLRVEEILKSRGYPIPGPSNLQIRKMLADGNWPPAEWTPR